MTFDFNRLDFRELIKAKENAILKRTTSGIFENGNFKRLLATLKTFHQNYPITGSLAILITKEEIENLKEEIGNKIIDQLNSVIVLINNQIIVDRNFDITDLIRKTLDDSNHIRRVYTEISKDYCVFYLSKQGIHGFVDGDDFGETIFFSPVEENRYNELKGIDQIEEVFNEYRQHLKRRDTYSKFFVPNSGKCAMHNILFGAKKTKLDESAFLDKHKQLLNNKPEDIFREDLRVFLEQKLQNTLLGKEYILENFKRLDIYITDDFGELYLIEVKWIGISIHKEGNRVGTSFDHSNINPSGINQTIDYVRELHQTGKKVKIGFLAVFDSRLEECIDTGEGYNTATIPKDLSVYYARFKKIPDLKVVNFHPR